MISKADRDWYCNGECHSLAVQLHRLRDFPLAVTGAENHAFVVIGPNLALDVNGVQTIRKLNADWNEGDEGRHRRVAESYFGSERSFGWPKPRLTKRTKRVAEELLGGL
jgi:hypothetical protein